LALCWQIVLYSAGTPSYTGVLQLDEEDLSLLLDHVQILEDWGSTQEFRERVQSHRDVRMWLSKVGYQTRRNYLDGLCYFLRSVGLDDPDRLFELKSFDDVKRRFYPVEKIVDYWIMLCKEKGLASYRIKKTVDAVRSFFKHNRARLIDVRVSYKPKAKPPISKEELLRFRDAMPWQGRILFDFLVSVPVRDGQFTECSNCGMQFYPRWRNILSFPIIEEYSPFVIQPEKGHESERYKSGLKQTSFLTATVAEELVNYKRYKEKILGRTIEADEPIFTITRNYRGKVECEEPLKKAAVKSLFFRTQRITGLKIYPHLIRSWVNSVLAAYGIDKQVRDLYLGHSCAYEEGYILQLIPLWQQRFREKHALEALDVTSPTQHQIIELEKELKRLKEEASISREDMEIVKKLVDLMKQGKVKF